MSEFIVDGDYDSDGSGAGPVGVSYFGGAKSDDSDLEHENNMGVLDSDSSSVSDCSDCSDSGAESDKLSFNGNFSDSDDETKETLGGSYIGLSEYGDIEEPVENADVTGGAHKQSTGLSSKIMAEVTDLGGINEINGGYNGDNSITSTGDYVESNESNEPLESNESNEYVSQYFDSNPPDNENTEEHESYIEGPARDSGDDAQSKLDEESYIEQNSELMDVSDNPSGTDYSEMMTGGRSNNIGSEDSENAKNLSAALSEFLKAAEGLK